jgi:hypothetical protein
MWKSATIKTILFAGAFVFGFVAGQWHHHHGIAPAPVTGLALEPAPVTCPVVESSPVNSATINSSALNASPANSPTTEIAAATISEPDSPSTATEITLSDFDNPDEQIKLTLTADAESFSQTSEQLVEDQDPLEPLLQLPQAEQLAYVQKLVESQEDAAVIALNDLMLTDDATLQNAAIDGLIALLEMRTGHFELIAENLQHNAVFLTNEQRQKVQKITQADASL